MNRHAHPELTELSSSLDKPSTLAQLPAQMPACHMGPAARLPLGQVWRMGQGLCCQVRTEQGGGSSRRAGSPSLLAPRGSRDTCLPISLTYTFF